VTREHLGRGSARVTFAARCGKGMMPVQLVLFAPTNPSILTHAELLGAACGRDPRSVEHLLGQGIGGAARRAVGDIRSSLELSLELARRVSISVGPVCVTTHGPDSIGI
jgi:hypothetical protein